MSQPQQNNIFRRKLYDYQNNPNRSPMSQERLIFGACILTINYIVSFLGSKRPWVIEQSDLEDYSNALVDIRQCLRWLNTSPVGSQYPFGQLIGPLNQAEQFLGEAIGQSSKYSKERTESIQEFRAKLDMILELVRGADDPPP